MPALGQTSDELRLIAWLKSEGEQVSEGDALLEVETDKATLEVEAAVSGTLLHVLCEPGQTVVAGTVVAWIGEPGEQVPEEQVPERGAADHAEESAPVGVATVAGAQGEPARRQLATPAARTLAREHGIDLAFLIGSGPGGRIERRDVLEAMNESEAQQGAEQEGDPVPKHRRAIATRLVRATSVPQFALSKTIDARRAVERVGEVQGGTLTHVLLQAVAAALRTFPRVNRIWVDDGPRFRQLEQSNVGLAIASDDNLVVATIPDADRLSLEELARTTGRVIDEGRAGRLVAGFSGSAAVTVSNLGMFGIDRFEGIVDPDQTAILAVGQVTERPAVTDEGIVAVLQLDLTLTVDHRTVDGAEAARFLAAICGQLER
jgi:pyruvate dehydrogenase E2 component (dihydrolipoamide acetyltransferase)